jgi:hypothetical protein
LNFPIVFQPEKARKSQFDIVISVIDDPKGIISFRLLGEDFSEAVILKGITEEDQTVQFHNNVVESQQEAFFVMGTVCYHAI